MKKCPFCAEEILSEAIKCRFCGEMLNKKPYKETTNASRESKATDRSQLTGKQIIGIVIAVAIIIWIVYTLSSQPPSPSEVAATSALEKARQDFRDAGGEAGMAKAMREDEKDMLRDEINRRARDSE